MLDYGRFFYNPNYLKNSCIFGHMLKLSPLVWYSFVFKFFSNSTSLLKIPEQT